MKNASLAAVAATALVLLPLPANAAGKAYRVTQYAASGVEGATGDREPGAAGAYWFPSAVYDNPRATGFPPSSGFPRPAP